MKKGNGMIDALLPRDRCSISKRPCDEHHACAQRERLQCVRSAPDPPLHHTCHIRARTNHCRQEAPARNGAVQLAATMVGYGHTVCARRTGFRSSVRVEYSLHDDMAWPDIPDHSRMLPG